MSRRLEGTELAKAQCSGIRLKVLKIGALIRITVRKVWSRWRVDILMSRYSGKSTKSCAPCR